MHAGSLPAYHLARIWSSPAVGFSLIIALALIVLLLAAAASLVTGSDLSPEPQLMAPFRWLKAGPNAG